MFERIDADHFKAGELFGGLHVADFGGERGTCATGEQQCGDHRTKLAQQRQGNHLPYSLLGTVLGKDAEALQRQHHADEHSGHHDDGQRHDAYGIKLFDQQLERAAGSATAEQRTQQKHRRAPENGHGFDRRAAEQGHAIGQCLTAHQRFPRKSASRADAGKWKGTGPSGSPCMNWRMRGLSDPMSSEGVPCPRTCPSPTT